jgi:hypothetical protein
MSEKDSSGKRISVPVCNHHGSRYCFMVFLPFDRTCRTVLMHLRSLQIEVGYHNVHFASRLSGFGRTLPQFWRRLSRLRLGFEIVIVHVGLVKKEALIRAVLHALSFPCQVPFHRRPVYSSAIRRIDNGRLRGPHFKETASPATTRSKGR